MIRSMLRKTPIRRTSKPRPRRRERSDIVEGRERSLVINRDRMCFLYRIDDTHVCTTTFGDTHSPRALLLLTVDHFWHIPGGVKGDRAPSDRYHMVAMCGGGNVGAPSKAVREAERSYIRFLYPNWIVTDRWTPPADDASDAA